MSVKTTSPCEPLFANQLTQTAYYRLPLAPLAVGEATVAEDANDKFLAVFRNRALPGRCVSNICAELDTYPKLFNNAVALNGPNPCLGWRPYNYQSKTHEDRFVSLLYDQVQQRKRNLGAGILRSLLANPYKRLTEAHAKIDAHLGSYHNYGIPNTGRDNNDHVIEKLCSFIVLIFAANRAEWILSDLACGAYSITNTALYDTLGPEVTQYILELTLSPMVILSKDKVETVLTLKKQHPKELENIISLVVMDPLDTVDQKWVQAAKELNVTINDLSQIEALGAKQPIGELPPTANHIQTISFTSGTTGAKPKGAMLSQANACAGISMLASSEPKASPGKNRAFIFLPLTHIYERQTSGFALSAGYYLGFPQFTFDNPKPDAFKDLITDLRLFKPTYFSLVPRILTKFESLVKNTIKQLPDGERQKVEEIVAWKLANQTAEDGNTGAHPEMDSYPPYVALQELVGWEKMDWTQTASAPVAASTLAYLKASLNTGVRQLYGLTETYGAHTNSIPWEANPGTCGSVGITSEQKLRSVTEMGYSIKENKGELLVGGSQVFKGYYYNQKETDKCFDDEGWFHTGDIARIDNKGRLLIIDRVKNFFKLAQGEYISPEKIEGCYLLNNPVLTQLYVHGDSVQLYLVGVCGVDFERGLAFLNDVCGYNKLDMTQHELVDEINKVENKRKFLKVLNDAVGNKLNGFEKLHNVYIELNPLTVERNVVTPTMKIKRGIASKYFGDVFSKLYEVEQSLVLKAREAKI